MDAYECLLTRRSIRRYKDTPISPDTIEKILRAAMSAPAARNQQLWHFVVISDKTVLSRIPAIHPHAQMAPSAACAILVCAEPALEKTPGYWEQDCSAATENILLAAHALGLGAVWCGIYPREERVKGLRELLGIPEGVIPFSLVPMGMPAEEKGRQDRYNAARVHREQW